MNGSMLFVARRRQLVQSELLTPIKKSRDHVAEPASFEAGAAFVDAHGVAAPDEAASAPAFDPQHRQQQRRAASRAAG